MTLERQDIPNWAKEERVKDVRWIIQNLPIFWSIASVSFEYQGRGLVYVDATLQPAKKSYPFYYLPRRIIDEQSDEKVQHMVRDYDPIREFVIMLQKTDVKSSTYRIKHPDLSTPTSE